MYNGIIDTEKLCDECKTCYEKRPVFKKKCGGQSGHYDKDVCKAMRETVKKEHKPVA